GALAQGKNLLFTPGVYHLNQTLNVTRPDTVVLGLGLATLVPDNGITAMNVADVDGVKLAGLLIDAGTIAKATVSLVINSNNVIGDHTWIWRADHDDANGAKTGWDRNTTQNG